MNIIEARDLGKCHGGSWALRGCTVAIPALHVAALVGPNGAGKTTLLNLAVGLAAPTAGSVTVLGGRPAGSDAALDGIAFVAQDTPPYRSLSAAEMLHVTRNLNRHFDGMINQTLRPVGIQAFSPTVFQPGPSTPANFEEPVQYLIQHGYTQLTTYQPARRFWPFQWIEGGWLVALSLLLITATVRLVHRRFDVKRRADTGCLPIRSRGRTSRCDAGVESSSRAARPGS